jgi:drug/metabolite transporter (DMT)-like permease
VSFDWMPTIYGLVAAATWGAGDFTGGIATRRANAYSVVVLAHSVSMFLLIVLVAVLRDPFPPFRDWLWGGTAGLGGGFGLILLYTAFANKKMAVVAPVSALVAAGIPVIVTVVSMGFPGISTLSGFILAFISIWLLSDGVISKAAIKNLGLPFSAGVAFGIFFLCLHQASLTSVLFPLIAVRIVSISSILVLVCIARQKIILTPKSLLPIVLSGFLDTLGNGAFALASRFGRVDVAAVIGSLYPGSTVLLAWILLKEQINPKQLIGLIIALIAIILITTKI